ncbi:MAG: porin [Candidatus Eisenbacteria bacterium]
MRLERGALLLPLIIILNAAPLRADLALESEDFTLKFDGRLRIGYIERYESGENESSANDRFLVEKAWLGFNGTCFDDFSYEMLWELRGYLEEGGPVEAKNIRIMYSPHKSLRFHLGQFKVPFGRKFIVAWPSRNSILLPAVAGSFLPQRDVGLMAQMSALDGKCGLYSGVFTGQGSNRKRDDGAGKKLYVARIEATPLGSAPKSEGDAEMSPGLRLVLGAGYASSEDAEPPAKEAAYLRTIDGKKELIGFDVTLKYKGLFLSYENNHAKLEPEAAPEFEAGGFLVQGSYFVRSLKLEPRVMYDEFDPSDSAAGDKEKTVTYGVNVLLHDGEMKIMLEYADHHKLDDGDERGWTEDELRLMVQMTIH